MLASLVSLKFRVPSPEPSLPPQPYEPSPSLAGKNVKVGWKTWGTKDKVAKSHNRSSNSSIPCAEEAWIGANPIHFPEGVMNTFCDHPFSLYLSIAITSVEGETAQAT